jgi:leader peptidase (prepilin peptidase) / N-methyltransferase
MLEMIDRCPFIAYFPWYVFFTALSFPLGLCIGSFLNVCIYRIPRELSVVSPRSHCPRCGKLIPWFLNIPVVSYLALCGRCRFCSGRISPRYALVETLTGVLFFLIWLKYSPDLSTMLRPMHIVPATEISVIPVLWLLVSGLVLGTFVDFEHLIIPDRVTLGGIIAGLTISGLLPELHGEKTAIRGLLWSSLGALAGWGMLWFIAIAGKFFLKKDAMGFGDVKLMGAIGAFLGSKAVLFTLVVSSFAGAFVGIALVLAGRRKLQSRIPYGPYIALAAVIWILWGETCWNAYARFFMPPIDDPMEYRTLRTLPRG